MKVFARGLDLEPRKVLVQSEFAELHKAYASPEDQE